MELSSSTPATPSPGAPSADALARAAGRAPAAAHARRGRRPGAPARPRARRCARAIEQGRPHSMILYGPPGSGKTTLARIVAAAAARRASRSSAPSRPGAPRCARCSSAPQHRRAAGRADGLLPRRDPPLQQGPAGRAAAGRRGGPRHAHRGDDREPLLRGQLGAALALRRSTSCARCSAADIEVAAAPRACATLGARGRRRRARVPGRARRRRRAHRAGRARARGARPHGAA